MDGLFPLSEVAAPLGGATISDCGTYRYTLDRVWDTTLPLALFVMLNPSTADAREDDPTIRRCRTFAAREGCGSLTVVNLFALRATDPAELRKHPDPVGPDNARWLAASLGRKPAVTIAAWGAHPFAASRADDVARYITEHGVRLHCLGTSKAGHPRHPLYLPTKAPLSIYRPRKVAA